MRRFLLTILAIAIGEVLGIWAANALAQEHRIVLRGTLFIAPDIECGFFLDPTGESDGIQLLQTLPDSWLCDWMKGSNAREIEIVMGSPSYPR